MILFGRTRHDWSQRGGNASTSRVIAFGAEAWRLKQLLSLWKNNKACQFLQVLPVKNPQTTVLQMTVLYSIIVDVKKLWAGKMQIQQFNLLCESSCERNAVRPPSGAARLRCMPSPCGPLALRPKHTAPITPECNLIGWQTGRTPQRSSLPPPVNLDVSCQGPASKTPPSGERGSERHSS